MLKNKTTEVKRGIGKKIKLDCMKACILSSYLFSYIIFFFWGVGGGGREGLLSTSSFFQSVVVGRALKPVICLSTYPFRVSLGRCLPG